MLAALHWKPMCIFLGLLALVPRRMRVLPGNKYEASSVSLWRLRTASARTGRNQETTAGKNTSLGPNA
ncbi:hypothetical protein HMPREF0305_11378 [Corynebacterium pseudogenitalium ATCC 33035]|uniref:Uncharacterized protein n=1 Tax=Corynebacterium pseudogenitalium ATCC 33035 TaxID=525264 RepID=E2S4C6_9CORY|nr:hypothetical protein HMPREF0305_11378 [Corynebacterium pseudogenitalium ATCC 33035]